MSWIRHGLFLVTAALFLAACASTPPARRTIAGVTVAPPLAPQPVTEKIWGTPVTDPYRFVENVRDPAVAEWMKGQADSTAAILSRIPGRDPLLARIREIDASASGAVARVRRTEGGRLFFTRREPGENQFKLVVREGLSGSERVLVDAEALGKQAGQPLAILDFAPSDDGRFLAYTLQVGGSEIGELHVVEVDSGRSVTTPFDRIRFAEIEWLDDSSGFFFVRLREGWEKLPDTEKFGDRTTFFFSLKTRQAQPVFSPSRNADLDLPLYAWLQLSQVEGTTVAAAAVWVGTDRNQLLYLGDLRAAVEGRAQWQRVVDGPDQVRAVAITRDWIYMLSAKNAPRHRVLRMPLAKPDIAKAEVIVPASEEVIVNIWVARDALYYSKRRGAALQLVRLPHDDPRHPETVALPFEGTVSMIESDPRRRGGMLSLVGWTRAMQYLEYQPSKLTRVQLVRQGNFDATPELQVREVLVASHDGTQVPVSILARRDVKLDGSNPTVLFGYGAYGSTQNPFFNPRLLAWIERGGVYVIAHVRGGGVLGTDWHLAAQKATKPNTWRDGIAVAEWLIATGYTSAKRLAINGGSAGGIFVGRAITERPELFAAAVPVVPVMDMVRSELDPNGPANVPEFGTVKDEAGFRALMAMSSYHHVKEGVSYPATLLVHGVNDTRVAVWQSAKFANRLATATSGGPVLMRLDYQLGHGGGSTRAQQQEQLADTWSFMLWQMGLPEFQPRP
jgi:prolyl oligopeptidase